MTPEEIANQLRDDGLDGAADLIERQAKALEEAEKENARLKADAEVFSEELREAMLASGYSETLADHWINEFRKRASDRAARGEKDNG